MRRDVAGSSARSRKERDPAPADGAALLAELWRDTATPVLLLDAGGGVIFSNRAFAERIGRKEGEMLGRPAPELFLTLEAPTSGTDLPAAGPITGRRLRLVRLNPKGSTPSTALCASQPLDDAEGRPVGTLLMFSQGEPSHEELAALVGTLGADIRTAARALRAPDAPRPDPAHRANRAIPTPPAISLSVREREVMGFLVSGRTPQAIAGQLRISPNTVRNHVRAIYRKLGVRSQLELLARVWERP
jgi:DNA-binding CsgD family transcriptional regulator